MPEDPIVAEAFFPLLSWAERTGRIHATERRTMLEAAAKDPAAVERQIRARQRGHYVPSAPELPAPPFGAATSRATSGRVAAELAQNRRVAASAAVAGEVGYAVRPDSMEALLSEASSTPAPGRQPTLFPEGDLPTITASGIPPQQLLIVPWQARPAVARASREEAAKLMAAYSGEVGAGLAEYDAMAGGPLYDDVREYARAYERWAGGFDS